MSQQVEKRLITEWLWQFHREHQQWKRIRLGQVPTRDMAQLYKVGLFWADAIVFDPPHLLIVEAKIRPSLAAIGQLEAYRELLKVTPEFEQFRGNPIRLVLLTTIEDRNVRRFCEDKGIEYIIFKPEWAEAYWKERLLRYLD